MHYLVFNLKRRTKLEIELHFLKMKRKVLAFLTLIYATIHQCIGWDYKEMDNVFGDKEYDLTTLRSSKQGWECQL